ncbi:hypothetical protein V496_00863 [Pseudogymnoascus sp. VKM F-4515 (FW-2607)]|nr:hypothetical protein V496_00863 [Pseudogymnoascus sp. VKM F-4515 (FW-2607)]
MTPVRLWHCTFVHLLSLVRLLMSSDNRHTRIDFFKASAQLLPAQHPEAIAVPPALSSSLVGNTPESASKKLVPKRSRSPKDDTDHASSVKISKLSRISESKPSASTNITARRESPWEVYEKVLDLDLNGFVTVAQRKARRSGFVAVRAFPVAAAEKTLYMHGRVRHANIVEALDAFTTETSFFIVLEHMPFSLDQIVQCAKYPTEKQLAAILIQILDGLVFLEREGLEHGSLDCSNIVLSTEGDVKIANQQCCDKSLRNQEPRDVRALGIITMELMQKYTQDNGAVGVENLDRWPSDSDAVTFLSETTSAASARELREHALLQHDNQKEVLTGLIFVAEVTARRYYSCSA